MAIIVKIVDDGFGIYHTGMCEFINPEGLCINEKMIKKYMKKHPFPKDAKYSVRDMIYDVSQSQGSYTLQCEKRDTAEWVADMIQELV